jgi:hypothetical protein
MRPAAAGALKPMSWPSHAVKGDGHGLSRWENGNQTYLQGGVDGKVTLKVTGDFPMVDRRRLLLAPFATACSLLAPPSWSATGVPTRRWVKILFVPTGERFNRKYFSNGTYIMPEVQKFSWTCRDYRANEWKWIHPWLMDLIFVLHWKYNNDEIRILSG